MSEEDVDEILPTLIDKIQYSKEEEEEKNNLENNNNKENDNINDNNELIDEINIEEKRRIMIT